MNPQKIQPVRVRRKTAETEFAIRLSSWETGAHLVELPNRILAHFIDHFARGAGIHVEVTSLSWPSSGEFDHVLCEDLGQLIGRGVAAIGQARTASHGIRGRAAFTSAMDDAVSSVSVGFESRPRCDWRLPRRVAIDGFVDSWYGPDGRQCGCCHGTNLRQFLDGFAHGGGATLVIEVQTAGNLHHLYETIFRNLGDAVGTALGTAQRFPGESSGLAGVPEYEVSGD